MKVRRWHKIHGNNKTSWDHEYMLPSEAPSEDGKYKVFDYDLPKSRLKQLHDYLSEKLLKEVLKK